MSGAAWLLFVFIAAVVLYTGYRIRRLKAQSEREWKNIDYSKLRKWEDDDT